MISSYKNKLNPTKSNTKYMGNTESLQLSKIKYRSKSARQRGVLSDKSKPKIIDGIVIDELRFIRKRALNTRESKYKSIYGANTDEPKSTKECEVVTKMLKPLEMYDIFNESLPKDQHEIEINSVVTKIIKPMEIHDILNESISSDQYESINDEVVTKIIKPIEIDNIFKDPISSDQNELANNSIAIKILKPLEIYNKFADLVSPEQHELTINMQKSIKLNEGISQKKRLIKIYEVDMNEETDIVIKCTVKEMAKKFIKDYKLIWYDLGINSAEIVGYIDIFKEKYSLERFNSWEDAVNFIKHNQIPSFVIASEINGEDFIKKIHNICYVKNIYIFCKNMENDLNWSNKYRKVTCKNTNFFELLKSFEVDFKNWQKNYSNWKVNLPAFVPIFTYKDISLFNKLYNYSTILVECENRNQAMKNFIELSKAVSDEKETIIDFQNVYTSYDMKKILNWYTQECFLYRVLNNCLRIATYDSILYCRLIISDLQKAIKDQYQSKSKSFHGIVYRGTFISQSELRDLEENLGNDIQIHGFMSTSKNRQRAIDFIGDNPQKALLTIIIPGARDNLENQGFAELKEFSDLPEEDEVLFNIMSRFRVLNVDREVINGIEHPKITLLYGAYELKRFLYESKKAININLEEMKQLICLECKLEYENKREDEPWFLNINDQTKSMCENCLKKSSLSEKDVMIMISSTEFFANPKEIKGFIMEPISLNDLKEAKFKCAICKKNETHQGLNYECRDCGPSKILICSECSIKIVNQCKLKKHIIIVHNNNFTIWVEQMTDSHYIHYQMLNKILPKGSNFRLGEVFYEDHNYQNAIQFYEEYLKKNTDKRITASCYVNIGLSYLNKEEYTKAIEYLQNSLIIMSEISGEMHIDIAITCSNIGSAYSKKGEYDKAIEYLIRSLIIKQQLLGEINIETALSYTNIGNVYFNKGEYEKALEYDEKSIQIKEKIFGKIHPEIAASYNNIGSTYNFKGEFDKAIEYSLNALKINQELLGELHSSTASSYYNIGLAYFNKGEDDKALEYYIKALNIQEEIQIENHSDLATCYDSIGLVYKNKGEYDKAMEYHIKAWKIWQERLGDNHPNIASSYNNIGNIYFRKGEFNKALEYHMRSLQIRQEILGESHPDTAKSYGNIGLAYANKREYDKGIEYLIKALKLDQKILGEAHPKIATAYENIGLTYYHKGEPDNAIENYLKSLRIKQEKLGEMHINTASTLNNIGLAYSNKREYDKAIEYYLKSLKIRQEILEESHDDIATSYNYIGEAYFNNGEFNKAAEYITKSLTIRQRIFGEAHPFTKLIARYMGI